MRRFRTTAAMVLAIAICAAKAADGQEDKNKVNIEGAWKITTVSLNGKDQPDFKDRSIVLTFLKDGKLTTDDSGKKEEGKYKIDAAKKPMEIDLAKGTGPKDDAKGIFSIDGDTLKIAIAAPGDGAPKRPAGFDEMGIIVLTLKKQAK
jgi:uncharacterized protein (TIGR03067 family)